MEKVDEKTLKDQLYRLAMLAETPGFDLSETTKFAEACLSQGFWSDDFLYLTDTQLTLFEKRPYFSNFLATLKWKPINDEPRRLKFLTTYHAHRIMYKSRTLENEFDAWYVDVGKDLGNYSYPYLGSQIGMDRLIGSYWSLKELPDYANVSSMGKYHPDIAFQEWLTENPEFPLDGIPIDMTLFHAMKIT